MNNNIKINIANKKVGELFYDDKLREYGFNYFCEFRNISLIMPYKPATYAWKNYLHPIFDMNMPEGYLFELLKKYLNKERGYINDFLIFSYLSPNIEGYLTYDSDFNKINNNSFDIGEVLENDNDDTFNKLVQTFMGKNAISGVQPKTIALLKEKESLVINEYIIKTWGEEYPELAQNEYFCMKVMENTGVKTAKIQLSKNNKFLLVERFNYDKNNNCYLGFEEVLVLLGKNRDEKYSGSYEQIAKVIYSVTTNKISSMRDLFKMIVMNFLLKNGDAHLKNFGVIYDSEQTNIELAPAYDIVNTIPYFYKDKPALTMFDKKVWFAKKELIKFGCEYCYLNKKDANEFYKECLYALVQGIENLEKYIIKTPSFSTIGNRMLDSWRLSLDEVTIKEIPYEIRRNW